MPITPNYDLDIDTTLGGSSASDYVIPSQKAVKDYVDNHSGGGADIDNLSITKNLSDKIQTVGIINQNNTTTALKQWSGTKAQYDSITTKDSNTIYNITDDETATEYANTDLNNLTNTGVQNLARTGMVVPFAGSTAPSGWLICDGSAISRTTYSSLFSVIGTTYGDGDGNTTFNIPTTQRVITETYSNGTDWYRIWSDGWIEQGSTLSSNVSSIIFLKQMADTNYQWYVNPAPADYGNFRKYCALKSTSGLTDLHNLYGTSSAHASASYWNSGDWWKVCGYVEDYISFNSIIKY